MLPAPVQDPFLVPECHVKLKYNIPECHVKLKYNMDVV